MPAFHTRLLRWFDDHGRHDLPWQKEKTPYRVWISEIMLQQTQVQTVIPYYERFMQRFPDVCSLADAEQDEVLHHWSGLGYYARARNLHKAAQRIRDEFAGQFPDQLDAVQSLPGIGRSTASAILAITQHQRHAILDGNVKRVLTRHQAIEGWPGVKSVENQLWQLAEQFTPKQRVADYTQAIMDLGATRCTRSRPRCDDCPVAEDCIAHQQDRVSEFPWKKPKKSLPEKHRYFLIARSQDDQVFLVKRPPAGIWGGLWSFPELETLADYDACCMKHFGITDLDYIECEEVRHTFSHFHLNITPLQITLPKHQHTKIMESDDTLWYNIARQDKAIGLAAPVSRLLDRIDFSGE